ncbi:hypothetical protein N7470_006547 [Penicillium chermesinum]|nr:hypothetical protein N7470_006547 [Penicillium chermesinum]
MGFISAVARPLQLCTRCFQWSSAVIVMGITSYFIAKGPHGQHIIYQEVIPSSSQLLSPFLPSALSKFVLLIDVVFSYLWLTAFIFAAQDYDKNHFLCDARAPPGASCSKKKANEAFIFLAFIFTFFGAFIEVASLWAYRKENSSGPVHEKHDGTRAPLDAPAPAAEQPAATV